MKRDRVYIINRIFLATVILSILGSFANGWISNFTDNYFVFLLISQVILILPSLFFILTEKVKLADVLGFRKIKISNIILIILFSYLITPVMTFINAISMIFVENITADVMTNVVESNGLLLSLFIVAVIPAILEESVYRGIFYSEYRKANPLKAIFLSAFLFGIIHLNLNQFTYAFSMGIIFALLIEATDSILSTMIVHFLINGNSVIAIYILPKFLDLLERIVDITQFNPDESFSSMEGNIEEILTLPFVLQNYLIPAIIAGVLAFIVYRTIAKNSGRWEHVKNIFKQNEPKGKLISYSLIAAIVICIILMILLELGS